METPPDDIPSWHRWYDDHAVALLLYARHLLPGLAAAEDAVQEAFVRTWRHLGDRPAGDPRGLLFTNLRRAALDLARSERARRGRQEAWMAEAVAEAPWFAAPGEAPGGVEEAERRRALEDALRRLPDEQREVVVLKVWGGFTFDEIASHLGIPPNTAASRYRYALGALRRHLSPERETLLTP